MVSSLYVLTFHTLKRQAPLASCHGKFLLEVNNAEQTEKNAHPQIHAVPDAESH